MPLSIEELDNQVRTFYEGRGEVVINDAIFCFVSVQLLTFFLLFQ